jgi:hypothetical protein
MQNPPTDRYKPPTSTSKYSPSVPISVYRELAAELQAAQTMVDSLKAQNQQLVKQNQQLRQEVEKVVQSAQHLQQIVYSLGTVSGVEVPQPRPVMQPEPRPVAPPPPPPPQPEPPYSPYGETLVIEQEETRSRRTSVSEGISDVSGWLLVVAILLIVLTAFGTGFLIVKPLLNNNNNNNR